MEYRILTLEGRLVVEKSAFSDSTVVRAIVVGLIGLVAAFATGKFFGFPG